MATVFIPPLMQVLTSGQRSICVPGSTLLQIISNLDQSYPGLQQLLVENNRMKPGMSVSIDGEISSPGLLHKVRETSEVHFVPAIGGGDSTEL